jgi:hypothetical protein
MRLLLRLRNIITHSDKLNAQMTGSNLVLKRDAIGRFMFNMAFENSIEDGYVTEKPFDALLAGDNQPALHDLSPLYQFFRPLRNMHTPSSIFL